MTTDDIIKRWHDEHPEEAHKINTCTALAAEAAEVARSIEAVTTVAWPLILGRSRIEDIALARMLLFCVLYNRGYSSSRVGSACNRNHATILHALKEVPKRYGRRDYTQLTQWVDELESKDGFVIIVKD